jgi:nicotinamide-nucleotide amidase
METETLAPAMPKEVDDLTQQVLKAAERCNVRLASAESCTGGLLASLLTDVDGLGHCFDRGIVAYSNESKRDLLGVPLQLIAEYGAVSEQVARAMAEGALAKSDADVVIAITGFAGKAGSDDEPGLVHFACANASERVSHSERHFGDIGRGGVRVEALKVALQMLLEQLQEGEERPARA